MKKDELNELNNLKDQKLDKFLLIRAIQDLTEEIKALRTKL